VKYRLTDKPDYINFHSHEDFEIFMFHRGVCRYLIHNQIYDLKPGDILLMDGLALHKPNILANSEYIRSNIHFTPEYIEPILCAIKANKLLNIFKYQHHYLIRTKNISRVQRIEDSIKRLDEINQDSNIFQFEKEWEIKLLLAQILVQINQLLNDSNSVIEKKSTGKTVHAEKIASFIQQHFKEKLNIADIEKALNLNKSYLSKVFKQVTGFTIMEYVMACRINHVKYLLEIKENQSIQHIAFESGFENISHFSRYFKEKVGMSPREYRKKRLEIYRNEYIKDSFINEFRESKNFKDN
jgi:AraC-like DNA-binding protein